MSRIEVDGSLGSKQEFGRCEKSRVNLDKKEEDYYKLDDDFIDDNTGVIRYSYIQESLIDLNEVKGDTLDIEYDNPADLEKFYKNFEFIDHTQSNIDRLKNSNTSLFILSIKTGKIKEVKAEGDLRS